MFLIVTHKNTSFFPITLDSLYALTQSKFYVAHMNSVKRSVARPSCDRLLYLISCSSSKMPLRCQRWTSLGCCTALCISTDLHAQPESEHSWAVVRCGKRASHSDGEEVDALYSSDSGSRTCTNTLPLFPLAIRILLSMYLSNSPLSPVSVSKSPATDLSIRVPHFTWTRGRGLQDISVAFGRYFQRYLQRAQLQVRPLDTHRSPGLGYHSGPSNSGIRIHNDGEGMWSAFLGLVVYTWTYMWPISEHAACRIRPHDTTITYSERALARRRTPGRNRTRFSNLPVSDFTICQSIPPVFLSRVLEQLIPSIYECLWFVTCQGREYLHDSPLSREPRLHGDVTQFDSTWRCAMFEYLNWIALQLRTRLILTCQFGMFEVAFWSQFASAVCKETKREGQHSLSSVVLWILLQYECSVAWELVQS